MSVLDAYWSAIAVGGPPALRFTGRPGCLPVKEVEARVAACCDRQPVAAGRRALLEGLALLWHDHFDACHERCQGDEGERDHDYLHALLHRREGDAANAGYWFARVGDHPAYPEVFAAAQARGLAVHQAGRLDPQALVAATMKPGKAEPALIALQAEELRAFAAYLLATP